MLRAAGDLGGDVDLVELGLEQQRGLLDVLVAVGAPLGDHRLDLVVLARVQRLEGEVLELPLERVDAEAVRERRVDLERLARLLELLLAAEVLDRAQVVQPVGELDQDDPHVLRHRQDQLAVVLGLCLLAAGELDPGQLGDALDDPCDVLAELGVDLLDLDVGVLDDVVEQRRRDRLLVEVQLGADLRNAERVVDEVLAGAPLLSVVVLRCEGERRCDELGVGARLVGGDVGQQLVEKILMPASGLDDGHQ